MREELGVERLQVLVVVKVDVLFARQTEIHALQRQGRTTPGLAGTCRIKQRIEREKLRKHG
ncbi:hypothetical protein GCM10028811_04180 [Uliginosibacterium sediminicola]